MDNIYRDKILNHYRYPRHWGHLAHPTNTLSGSNNLCGDEIKIELIVKNQIVEDIAFISKGCVISKASASMLFDYLYKKPLNRLKKLDRNFMIKLLGINLGPTRLKCALLPLETAQKIIRNKKNLKSQSNKKNKY